MQTNSPMLVLGAGSWGTALALVLARNAHQVYLWDIDTALIKQIDSDRENQRYIPGVTIPENIFPIESLDALPADIQLCVVVVPSHALRESIKLISHFKEMTICLANKGFEPDTHQLNHIVVNEEFPDANVAVLTGPSFAKEVAKELPTAVTIAAQDIALASQVAAYFHSETFRIYTHDDVIGAQVGGAVKNVMAIAAGIADGLGFGANTRSALITRGLAEIMRLGIALGGKPETFMGLAGLGDLVLTCTDDQSRNRRLGLLLAKDSTVDAAVDEIGQAIEGIKTAKEVATLAEIYQIDMPITQQVQNVLSGRSTPYEAVRELLSREQKSEQ